MRHVAVVLGVFALLASGVAVAGPPCKGTKVWCKSRNECTYPSECRRKTEGSKKGASKTGFDKPKPPVVPPGGTVERKCDFGEGRPYCGWSGSCGPYCCLGRRDDTLWIKNVNDGGGTCMQTYLPITRHGDVKVSMRVRMTSGVPGLVGPCVGNAWGIAKQDGDYMEFGFDSTGRVALYRARAGTWYSDFIRPLAGFNPRIFNTLTLTFKRGKVSGHVNGKKVFSRKDVGPRSRQVGLCLDNYGQELEIDWLRIERP